MSLRDLATQFRWELPRTQGVETLAGLLLTRLGHIPKVGEFVEIEGRRLEVTGMDRHRIARVKVDPVALPADEDTDESQTAFAGGVAG